MPTSLEIDLDQKLNLDLQVDIVGRRIAVLGVSGQGKTNTAAVLIEEILSAGLPCTIVDPEGEYWGLKEKFEILVVGSGEHTDFPAGPDQAKALAALSVAESISMVLDLSEFKPGQQADFLLAYFTSLWFAVSKKKTPYEVVIEEAHEFIPEGVRTPLKEELTRIALRGRKRGLGAIIISQRSAGVAKSFLTQAEMLFLHRVVHPTDLRVYKDLIPLPAKEVEELVGQLIPGQVVFVYNHAAALARIRPRHTFHAGATPQLDAQVAGRLKRIDKKLLDKLAQAVKASAPAGAAVGNGQPGRSDKEAKLEQRVKEQEVEITSLKALVADLTQQVATLKDLKVRLESHASAVPVPAGAAAAQNAHQVAASLPLTPLEKMAEQPAKPRESQPPAVGKVVTDKLRTELNEYDQRRLNPYLNKLGNLNEKEITLLTFLIEHDGKFFTRQEVMRHTGMFMRNFYRDFQQLLKLPFIENQTISPASIKTRVKEWAQVQFPGVEPGVILRQIKNQF